MPYRAGQCALPCCQQSQTELFSPVHPEAYPSQRYVYYPASAQNQTCRTGSSSLPGFPAGTGKPMPEHPHPGAAPLTCHCLRRTGRQVVLRAEAPLPIPEYDGHLTAPLFLLHSGKTSQDNLTESGRTPYALRMHLKNAS